MLNIDEVLLELSYRVDNGIVDLTNRHHMELLKDIIRENSSELKMDEETLEKARIIFEYLTEANKSVSSIAKEKGLEGKGGIAYGPIGKDIVTHINKSGSLLKLPKPKALGKSSMDKKTKGDNVFGNKGGAKIFEPTKNVQSKDKETKSEKDKSLKKINTLETPEFKQKVKPDDSEFSVKNKKFQIGPPPQPYKIPSILLKNPKVAPRHLKELERLMNTKSTDETAKWSHFSDLPGGAGQISAQAGELMTLIGTTLDDKESEMFYKSLLEHEVNQVSKNPKLEKEGARIVTKSWIQAAQNNRKAIRNRLSKEYPNASITAGSWDTQGEVEAMGLTDYKKNKGFSTDVYFKIKTKEGKEILDEVSLKKSTAVNFLNSGTGKLLEWDPNVPDNINPLIYQKKERKMLQLFGSKNSKALENAIAKDKEALAILKAKKMTLKDALQKMKEGKASRDVNKVVMASISAAAKQGNKASISYLDLVQKEHKKHQKDVISALGNNKKLKEGMLSSIREEFPLKAVGEGEESMAIGANSLDRDILKEIFKTSDFDKIKEGLVAVTKEEPPYLAYRAKAGGAVIPIATIGVREDGVGYGGQIKFEMQLDRRFAKILEAANKKIYG